jgi:hypothetical protein
LDFVAILQPRSFSGSRFNGNIIPCPHRDVGEKPLILEERVSIPTNMAIDTWMAVGAPVVVVVSRILEQNN